MKNKYEVRGDITAIFLKSKKYGPMETLIDTDDLKRVSMEYDGSWYTHWGPSTKSFYVRGNIKIDGKKTVVSLHRWITNAQSHLVVDHINHDTLDNRHSCNLRKITHAENLQNRKGAQSNGRSGIRGVSWSEFTKKWQASLELNGKKHFLGYFDDIEQAQRVVKAARKELMPYSQEAIG